jgi:hypothetical protein
VNDLGALRGAGCDFCQFSVVSHLVKKHRFANAPQPNHQHTFGRISNLYSFDGNPHTLAQFISTGELRRWCSGAR